MLQKENDFREASESGIEALSLAIVKQAFDDFVSGEITDYEFTDFLYGSWYETLCKIDPNVIYKYALEERKKEEVNFDSTRITKSRKSRN